MHSLQGMGLKSALPNAEKAQAKNVEGRAMMFRHPVASKFPGKSICIKMNRTASSFAAYSHPDLHGDVLDRDGYANWPDVDL